MATTTTLHCLCSPNPINNTTFNLSLPKISPSFANPNLGSIISPTSIPRLVSYNNFGLLKRLTSPVLCGEISTFPTSNTHYEVFNFQSFFLSTPTLCLVAQKISRNKLDVFGWKEKGNNKSNQLNINVTILFSYFMFHMSKIELALYLCNCIVC